MTHDLPATLPRSLPPCSLIGAPTDIGAGARGASMGPEALRVAGLQAALELHGLQVLELHSSELFRRYFGDPAN